MTASNTQPDLVGIIESVYRLDQDAPSWLCGILERLDPWIGDGAGTFAFAYSVSSRGELVPGVFGSFGCSPEALSVLPAAAARHEPSFVRAAYVDVDFAVATQIPEWSRSEGREFARRDNVGDIWAIIGRNWGGPSVGAFVNRRLEGVPSSADRKVLVRIAAHLAAAERLRQRLHSIEAVERAEAIIAPDGKVQHAVGEAKLPASLASLRNAALSVDRARGKMRKREPERALGMWEGLVAARWTLIDHFESDGRRYFLAEENEPAPAVCKPLSPRERQVLANAMLGRSNKEIAYALGIAHSTVRVLLTRAMRKLDAPTRAELLRRFEALDQS